MHPRRSEERRSRSGTPERTRRRWTHSGSSSFRAGDRNRRETNRGQSQNEPGSSRDLRDSPPSRPTHPADGSNHRYNPAHRSPGTRSQTSSSVRSSSRDNNSGQNHNRRDRYDQQYSDRRRNEPYPERPTNRDHMIPRQNQRHHWRPQRFPVNYMGWTGGLTRYPNFPHQNRPLIPIFYSDGSTWYPPRLQRPPPPYGGQYPPHVDVLQSEWVGIPQIPLGMIEGIHQNTQNTVNTNWNYPSPLQPYGQPDQLLPQLPYQTPNRLPYTQQMRVTMWHPQPASSVPIPLQPPVPTPQPPPAIQTLWLMPAEAHAVSSTLEERLAAVERQIPILQATTTRDEVTRRDQNTTANTSAGDTTATADTEEGEKT